MSAASILDVFASTFHALSDAPPRIEEEQEEPAAEEGEGAAETAEPVAEASEAPEQQQQQQQQQGQQQQGSDKYEQKIERITAKVSAWRMGGCMVLRVGSSA
jgi:hypothetical protein